MQVLLRHVLQQYLHYRERLRQHYSRGLFYRRSHARIRGQLHSLPSRIARRRYRSGELHVCPARFGRRHINDHFPGSRGAAILSVHMAAGCRHACLFLYAICFSYAYITLSAGAGALILFGFVQGTMIAIGLWSGDRPTAPEWLGWLLAFAGLVWLVLPGVEAPPLSGASLMAIAGIAWGIYSIRGRAESDALASTASNFVLTVAMVAVVTAVTFSGADISSRGITLAIVSGAITSGIGYVIWYAALEYLSAIQAALVQLSVPAIATAGGVMLLVEPLSLRLLISSALVLGGISIALSYKINRL